MAEAPTPKDRFSSLDTLALARELRALGSARIEKAFDLPVFGWALTLRSAGAGRRELLLVPGRFAALLDSRADRSEDLSPFARELRRLLSGARIRTAVEPMGERYLELILERGSDPGEIVLGAELFGAGNLLVARAGVLAAVARPRRWAHRDLRIGRPYARPPARPDPWTLEVEPIQRTLGQSRTDLASTLAARLGLGGPVAEEVLSRAGLPGGEPSAPQASEAAPRVHAALAELVAEIGERPRGFLVVRGEELLDAAPYPARRWGAGSGIEVRELATFSEAAWRYFPSIAPPVEDPEAAAARAERKDLERLAERQEEAVRTLAGRAEALRDDANAVFTHYAEAEKALGAATRLDPVPAKVAARLGSRTVELPFAPSPRGSAQVLYNEAKRLAAKLEGAKVALESTRGRLAAPSPPASRPRAAAGARAVRKFWFERFRWFLSSEGAIVLGGRDASSNDVLVRRHLKKGDLYVHADLHGAASVVVKATSGSSGPGDPTIREAAQWAVAFSKAWRAGLAAAGAFWATPDQVSKSAGSGEFVAKGAWIVRGTKHFVKDLPLELSIGTVDYDGETRWTVAPPAALESRGRVRARFRPGDERERGRVEAELARELGVSRTVLQGLLPAGGLEVLRP